MDDCGDCFLVCLTCGLCNPGKGKRDRKRKEKKMRDE